MVDFDALFDVKVLEAPTHRGMFNRVVPVNVFNP
jgi:hypothetical protein